MNLLDRDVTVLFRIQYEPFDLSCQFSHVARPGVGLQGMNGIAGYACDGMVVATRIVRQEMRDQDRRVLGTLSQWRHLNLQRCDSVIEVFAKCLLPRQILEALVCG